MILLCDLEKLVLVSTYKKKVKQVMVPLKHVHFPQRSTTSAGLHLINLISYAHLNPDEMKGPIVKIKDLIKRNEGLIILSGGVNKGFIPNSLKANKHAQIY